MLLIDTNIAIDLRDGKPEIVARITALDDSPVISIFTLIELEGGIYANPALIETRRARVNAMLGEIAIAKFEPTVVSAYGRIVAHLGFSRTRIIDRLIAATAIVGDFTLATANSADFREIPGLSLEVWPTSPQ